MENKKESNGTKIFWSCVFSFLAGLCIYFLTSCAGSEVYEVSTIPETLYSYEWSETTNKDTVILICNQNLSFETSEGKTQQYKPVATVKLYTLKDEPINFGASDKATPEFKQKTGTSNTAGNFPERVITRHQFELSDGQTVVALVTCERYYYTSNGGRFVLPYMNVTDVLQKATQATKLADAEEENMWKATIWLIAKWQVEGKTQTGRQEPEITYLKKQAQEDDVLLNRTYTQGYNWLTEKTFQLYVDETELWRIAGEKVNHYTSPELVFNFVGKDNKTETVSNFEFTGKLNTTQARKEDIGAVDWVIKKGLVTHTVAFSNNTEQFNDVFTYPAYEASYSVNGQTFDFDLSINFKENYKVDKKNDKNAVNTTTAQATVLERTFTQTVTSTLNLNESNEPDPGEDPTRPYGEILGYKVTAVFNVNNKDNNGKITEKCLCIRYEDGYEWGVCAYDAAFPETMTYVKSGYTGFNSAAFIKQTGEYRIARAEDSAQGLKWYAEDNSLLSAIDELTCKIYGWQNLVNGQYSTVVGGYQGKLSASKYGLTLTAPDGTVKVFRTAPLR